MKKLFVFVIISGMLLACASETENKKKVEDTKTIQRVNKIESLLI